MCRPGEAEPVHLCTHTHIYVMLKFTPTLLLCSMCSPLAVSPVMWTLVSVTFQPYDCLLLCNIPYFWVMLPPPLVSRRSLDRTKLFFSPHMLRKQLRDTLASFHTHDARMTVHIQTISYSELAVRSVTNIFTLLKQQSLFFFWNDFQSTTSNAEPGHVTRFCTSCLKRVRRLVGYVSSSPLVCVLCPSIFSCCQIQ